MFEGSNNLTLQIEPSNITLFFMGLSLLQEGLIQSLLGVGGIKAMNGGYL
jgi:hypothetical protein